VREAGVEATSARNRLKAVQTQANKNDPVIETLGKDLTILKEKIKEAREKVSKVRLFLNRRIVVIATAQLQVRISVKSDNNNGLCRRSYMWPASPTPVNVLSVKYQPAQEVTDSLIFITKTKSRRSVRSLASALKSVIRGSELRPGQKHTVSDMIWSVGLDAEFFYSTISAWKTRRDCKNPIFLSYHANTKIMVLAGEQKILFCVVSKILAGRQFMNFYLRSFVP
jgi:hypothetical protein